MKKSNIVFALFIFLSVTLNALSFSEDWESGDFSTNGWSFDTGQGNWEIWEFAGNPGNSAKFAGFPTMNNYQFYLVSPMLDGTDSESAYISFDFIARIFMPRNEHLDVVIRTDGGDWTTIETYSYNTPGGDDTWSPEQLNISEYACGNNFQFAFKAYGTNSMSLTHWEIDNVSVFESLPQELPFFESWSNGSFTDNGWGFSPSQASWQISIYDNNYFAEFLFDDYLNYSFALTSQTFSALEQETVELSYDLGLFNYNQTATEFMAVEINDGTNWQEVASYCNDAEDFNITETIDISEIVSGNLFQLRFRAHGDDAFNIDSWTIDNIIVSDGGNLPSPRVYGHVIDSETLLPVTDAVVYIDTLLQVTFNEGGLNSEFFGFDFENLSSGNFELSCTAPGYSTNSRTLSLFCGEEQQIEIFLEESVNNQVPENLQAMPVGYLDVNLFWTPVSIEEYLEEAYDDGTAEEFIGFQAATTQIIANRFQFSSQIEVLRTQYFVDFGDAVPNNEDPQICFYIVAEENSVPDLNNLLTEPVYLNNLTDSENAENLWLNIPTTVTIEENIPFYICMEWIQNDPADEFISLGSDTNSPLGNSFITSNSGQNWNQLTGDLAQNAMIRCNYIPDDSSDQLLIGYNLYRDSEIINEIPVTESFFNDYVSEPGNYTYQVSALYNDIESDLSDPVIAEMGVLPPPYYINTTLVNYECPKVNIGWLIDIYPETTISGYNIYKNGELLNDDLLPAIPCHYEDTEICNGEIHSYQIVAVYLEGESELSMASEVNVLLSPKNFYAIPWEDRNDLFWDEVPDTVEPVELIGYNIYKNNIMINDLPVNELCYTDYDFEGGCEYQVYAFYTTGESQIENTFFLDGGQQVIMPPQSLSAEIEHQNVVLSWDAPEVTGNWQNWDDDSIGESFGMEDNEEFTAVIEFDENDLLQYHYHSATKVAFYPACEADYTLTVWTNNTTIPENYSIVDQFEITDYEVDKWNSINFSGFFVQQNITKARIGITCSNYTNPPLFCDMGPNNSEKADLVLINDQFTNLSSDYGLDANWKIRVYIDQVEPVNRDRSIMYDLWGYNIYRDNELIDEICSIDNFFIDHDLEYDQYTYNVSAVYNINNVATFESEFSDPLDVSVIDPYHPAPVNFSAVVGDYNYVALDWELPDPERNEAFTKRDRELTGFNVYRNSEVIVSLDYDEFSYTDSLLNEGNYTYNIMALYEPHISESSPEIDVIIAFPAPINLSAENSEQGVNLSWEMIFPDWNLQSFKVFRNYELVAENLTDLYYIDEEVFPAHFLYQVQAVFAGDFESEMSEVLDFEVTSQENSLLPKITKLNSNYPNPFNPHTTICFSLAEPEIVTLNIYNIKGELIKTVINESLDSGNYHLDWNGKSNNNNDVASGIYFCSLKAGNYHSIKKLSLLR